MPTSVTMSGPLYDGRADKAVVAFLKASQDDVAQYGDQLVLQRLPNVLRHPTGHYQSTIHVVKSSLNDVVDGDGTIYSRWLEGTGSRNKTTRFKGYFTFRLIGQRLNQTWTQRVQPLLTRYVKEMN